MAPVGNDSTPLVTVVVPARDEAANIRACLEAVFGQTYPEIEVVLADGCSVDDTVVIAEKTAAERGRPLRTVANPGRTVPHALNAATTAATGAFLVRVDAHTVIPPTYVATVVELLATGEWAGVGGRKTAGADDDFGRAFAVAYGSRLAGGAHYHHGTARRETDHVPFGAYPRYVVRALGGWDEALPVSQDVEFDFRVRRAGGRLAFDPGLHTEWRPRQTWRELAYQYYRYGGGKARVVRKHPAMAGTRQLAPALMILGAAGAAGATAVTRRPGLLAPVAAYVGAMTAGGLRAAHRARAPRRVAWRVPGMLMTMHHAWGVGFLRGLVRTGGGPVGDPFRANPGGDRP